MQKKNNNLINSFNYNIVSIQINKKRKIARCRSFAFDCEQCNEKCLANKNNPLTIEDFVKAKNQARAAKENLATQFAEDKLKQKEQLKAQAAEKAAAEKAKREAEEKAAAEKAQEEKATAEQPVEQTTEPAPEQEKGFKLTAPAYMDEVLPRMATKRARKLIYTPKEVVFETSCKIDTAGKKNDEGIKIKNILDAEIKEGLKLGYLEKYDGLKTSEIKEEYENDTVYEIAEQEFKKSGLLADGNKVKLFIYDWTGGVIHHVGYLPDDKAAEIMPFLNDMDKYSFDICSIITGGKSKTIKKDPETGKFTITKNKDGDYGIDLDITIINRKD